ncbi:FtsX-like permease family protein [bacterium]|nr:FtsX-like permease family protein [bacterium]
MKDFKLILKLALRNLFGTGIRLWINVTVLAISIIIVIFARSIHAGLGHQMKDSVIRTEIAAGQLISKGFDPHDPITFEESRRKIPDNLNNLVVSGEVTPILYCSATVYSRGIVHNVTLRGIKPEQKVLELPTENIGKIVGKRPLLVGTRMLSILKLSKGDMITIKWRDKNGAFDADEFVITELMDKNNPRIDTNVLWLSLDILQNMYDLKDNASIIVFKNGNDLDAVKNINNKEWVSNSAFKMTQWIRDIVVAKEKGNLVIFAILLFLCCVGIFNSQILEVFKRTHEIGLLMAMGLRKMQIVMLFTFEGILIAIFGILGAFILGTPIFYWIANVGIPLEHTKGMGMPIPERIYPYFSFEIISITLLIILLLTTFTAWFPTRKIASMEAAKAISGRK